jgi:hypothetical protein
VAATRGPSYMKQTVNGRQATEIGLSNLRKDWVAELAQKLGALGGTRTPNLLIRRFPYGYPHSFGSVRHLGGVPVRCSLKFGEPGSCSPAWLPAWLPAWRTGASSRCRSRWCAPRAGAGKILPRPRRTVGGEKAATGAIHAGSEAAAPMPVVLLSILLSAGVAEEGTGCKRSSCAAM